MCRSSFHKGVGHRPFLTLSPVWVWGVGVGGYLVWRVALTEEEVEIALAVRVDLVMAFTSGLDSRRSSARAFGAH